MARYALNMPVQLKRDAERIAAEQGVSLNQLILWALAEKVGALNAALDDPAFPGIAYRRGAAGMPQAVLRGRGIRVQTIVVAYEHEQLTITDIAAEYELTVAQVEEALQFYRAHAADVDRHIDLEATIVNDQFAPETAPGRRRLA